MTSYLKLISIPLLTGRYQQLSPVLVATATLRVTETVKSLVQLLVEELESALPLFITNCAPLLESTPLLAKHNTLH